MEITLKVRDDVAPALQRQVEGQNAANDLLKLTDQLGVSIRATHPGSQDPLLSPYFTVQANDPSSIDAVLEALRGSDGVEAAYVKPADELP